MRERLGDHRTAVLGVSLTLLAALGIALAAGALSPPEESGADPRPRIRPGEVLVRFETGASRSARGEASSAVAPSGRRRLLLPRTELLTLPEGLPVAEAVARLERQGPVAWAEPNYVVRVAATGVTNDPGIWDQWNLHATGQGVSDERYGGVGYDADIDAPEAWRLTTGTPAVTIAIVDTGLELGNRDLAPNLWQNAGESGTKASNGIDDDGNGYVDDLVGWDFADDDADPDDLRGHGTAVGGAAGGRGGNRTDLAGVAWSSRLMALKASSSGSLTSADIVDAFTYAGLMGARVVNASFGGLHPPSSAEKAAIESASGSLFVTAAGSLGGEGFDLDTPGADWYPCEYDLPNVICVTSTFDNDRVGFDNWGATAVDIGAPGLWVPALRLFGGWDFVTGTSIATPQVSGAAALILAREPSLSPAQVRERLIATAQRLTGLQDRVVSDGQLNVGAALGATGELPVDTRFTAGPKKVRAGASPRFRVESPSFRPARYEYKLDGRPWRRAEWAIVLRRPAVGRHTLRARAVDRIGRRDLTPALRRFRVVRRTR